MNPVTIGKVAVGGEARRRVVAEIGANHNGKRALALRLVEAACAAGADLVKFQCYTLDEIAYLRRRFRLVGVPAPWSKMGFQNLEALYARAQTPLGWFPALAADADRCGTPWLSSVFGLDSLAFLEGLGCPAYKLSAWDEGEGWLRREVAGTGKPTIASVRAPPSVRFADIMLHCPEGYPQGDFDFAGFAAGRYDGLSFHGTDWRLPALAAASGAAMVEVHVQLDDEPSELDAHSSLCVSDFARLCEAVRELPTTEMM